MKPRIGQVNTGDCVKGLSALDASSIDLVFADPPFNIGYDYDKYDDDREHTEYLDWCREWIGGVYDVLKPNGTFWLAIGDEYAAELKLIAQEKKGNRPGFHCRSWVVWYYTFGVHCTHKFTRSHAHLFHFVKDKKDFTFNSDDVRVPSARQLVYADKRANPKGRLPDDTWIIPPEAQLLAASDAADGNGRSRDARKPPTWGGFVLRPQDIPNNFRADEDAWYFARVAGTFKEREGWHGCQMPEQLLGRIIRACSNEGDIVLDPFAGSGTTLVVAKKLKRQFVGFELSTEYAAQARDRLAKARVGSDLDGVEKPIASAPRTPSLKPATRSAQSRKKAAQTEGESLFTAPDARG